MGVVRRAVAQVDLCVVTLWRLSRGESAGAAEGISRLRRRLPDDAPTSVTTNSVCAALLEAKLGAEGAVDRLDSIMRAGPSGQRNGPPVAFTLSPAFVRSVVGISPVTFEDFANRGMMWRRACNPEGPGLRGLMTANVVRAGRVVRGSRSYFLLKAPPATHFSRAANWCSRRFTGSG